MADTMHCFTCGGKTSGVEGYRPVPSKTAHPAAPKDGPCTCGGSITNAVLDSLGVKPKSSSNH